MQVTRYVLYDIIKNRIILAYALFLFLVSFGLFPIPRALSREQTAARKAMLVKISVSAAPVKRRAKPAALGANNKMGTPTPSRKAVSREMAAPAYSLNNMRVRPKGWDSISSINS